MKDINKDMENKLRDFNYKVRTRYDQVLNINGGNLRSFLEENIGRIYRASKPSYEELLVYEKKGGIVGVDGSVNRKGGASPHYVELFRALAKSTIEKLEAEVITEIYSPILEEDEDLIDGQEEISSRRDEILAKIEVEVAIRAAKELKPYLIMMDGSFIRYLINCKKDWEELRYICEKEKIILIGVIEDIKTKIIGDRLVELGYTKTTSYDRELLFGKLDMGEFILIDEKISEKASSGQLSSLFMRSALSPNIIGIDIIDTQRKDLREIANLVYGLTPENSRGIPIWLDIVDREVKISTRMMESYLETYLDRDIYERFFVETRSKRS